MKMKYGKIDNYINGQAKSGSGDISHIYCPADDSIIATLQYSTASDVDEAVMHASKAQESWKKLTFKERAKVIFKLRNEFEKNREEIAQCITDENGKAKAESYAAVDKAIELCEFAVSVPAILADRCEYVSKGIEVKEISSPVGVVASITPFNFPLMVPMWTIANAIVCGNAMILKPSELTPITAAKIAQCIKDAGVPEGIFQVVHGGKDVVEAICDHPGINVVTFVGSTPVAKIVYQRATSAFKRCLSMGGAKNHILVTPEVNPQVVANEICSAAYGMSGQRCMAASVLVAIGNCKAVIDEVIRLSKSMVVGKDMPPLVTRDAVTKVHRFIESTKGNVLVDGRAYKLEGNDNGYYIGPTVIEYDDYHDMSQEEIFAPTLEIIHVKDIEEALAVQNSSPYANGASIFTDTGRYAHEAVLGLSSGMLGVNIGVPVPRDPFSFGGLKASKFGLGDITGFDSLPLYINKQKVTTKWNPKDKKDWMS